MRISLVGALLGVTACGGHVAGEPGGADASVSDSATTAESDFGADAPVLDSATTSGSDSSTGSRDGATSSPDASVNACDPAADMTCVLCDEDGTWHCSAGGEVSTLSPCQVDAGPGDECSAVDQTCFYCGEYGTILACVPTHPPHWQANGGYSCSP